MLPLKEAIIVENLAKQYTLGQAAQQTMLRERLAGLLRHPLRALTDSDARKETIWALNGVSFKVQEGEVVGLIGRNGAGKSTLLKILSRITYPTSGQMTIRGRVASMLEVGTGFHDELTGRENIYLNGSILGMKKKEVDAKLDAIIAFSGVERFIDTPIKRYSSGMRLRLGFAVAAHLEPDVLLVDEVLAVGDAGFQKKCLNTMEDLRSGGRTVLFVSHNMAAVENLCSRAIWIDDGKVKQDGPAKDVIADYLASFAEARQEAADLRHVTRHQGTGEVRFTGLEFLSPARQPQPVTRSGDGLVIRFHYHADGPVALPTLRVRLYTEFGTLVTETGTWHHGISIPLLAVGDGCIELEIESLNLAPARYDLSLWILGSGATRVYDCLEHAAHLDVEPGNIYRSGRVIDSRYGIVYFPQTWHLNPLRAAESDPAGPVRLARQA
ncbi:MAG: ABC transporter ATP-binding protein [Vicinamibacterales bacterium]